MTGNHRIARRLLGVELSGIRRVRGAAAPDAVDLGLGEPDLPVAAAVSDAARAGLRAPRLSYTPNAGLPELRRRIAELASRRAGRAIAPESVCVTAGSTHAFLAAVLATVDPGDEVLVPDPGYPAYAAVARLAGAEPVAYPLPAGHRFAFAAAEVEARLTGRTRAIVVNSPANPTGTVAGRDELEELARLAAARRVLVIADEVYRELHYGAADGDGGGPPTTWHAVDDGGIVIDGLSKCSAMTGWRLGWLVAPPELAAAATVITQYSVACAPTLSQHAALAALGDGLRADLEQTRRRLATRRDLMVRTVDERLGLPRTDPQAGLYLMLETTPGGDSLELALELASAGGVVTAPGSAFGDEARSWLRLSFGAREEAILRGVERLADHLGRS